MSLINNDLKILTKIHSNRLSIFLSKYIHKDQAGFIPGRQGLHQVWRAIDVISLLCLLWDERSTQEGFLLSIDLQKAFDMLPWPYLFEVLERWGFAPHFMGTLRALYSNHRSKIHL